jgi:hypothetical protein
MQKKVFTMVKGKTKPSSRRAQKQTPSGAARTLIIPKKGGRISAERIKKAIVEVFAAKEAARS